MKLSVSLSEADVEFIDAQTRKGAFASRSAVLQEAIHLLRDREHVDSYALAWDEWDSDGAVVWDAAASDGLR